MTRYLILLASLVGCSASTTAQPAAPSPKVSQPIAECIAGVPGSTLILEVDRLSRPEGKHLSKLLVFDNGSWSYVQLGEAVQQRIGCLNAEQVTTIERGFSESTWTETTGESRCMAVATESTRYSYRGREVHTKQRCSGSRLDASSSSVIAATDAMISELDRPRPSGTCAPEGEIVFQIDEGPDPFDAKSSVHARLVVHANGGWSAMRSGKTRTGCFTGDEARALVEISSRSAWRSIESGPDSACVGISHPVTYSVNGRTVLVDRVCDGRVLDEPSRKELARINAILFPILH